ncbi:MAG: HAMP domain-containing protein [Thermoanaerobaculia bacterium]|nr:HAMP domain-containing protein [Thermoanaerobaculia bacterium]
MSRFRPLQHFSIPGRLILLFALPLLAAGIAAALASRWGASPSMVFLLVVGVGLSFAAVAVSRALAPSLALLEALGDGIDGWQSGDFSLRLAADDRRDELGRLIALYNAMGHVLRRERNELRQRELLLQTVIETSPAAVLLLDERQRIELANRQAHVLLSDTGGLLGTQWSDLRVAQEIESALGSSTGQSLVSVVLGGSEETFHVTRRDLDLNARRHSLLMIHRVTAELRRQEVMAWKKVLRVIAHELNNSLAPIQSVAHTARQMLHLDRTEQLDEALETIEDSATRLHQFIDGYARFARLPEPRRTHFSVAALIEELRRLEPFELEARFPEKEVYADSAQLQQALLNLLRNAREAGSPVHEITLTAHDLGPGGLRLEVQDRGSGMTPEILQRALLPFFSTKPDGTGLGLALAREIFEAHGGRLDLASRPRGGLTVTAWLPSIEADLEPQPEVNP